MICYKIFLRFGYYATPLPSVVALSSLVGSSTHCWSEMRLRVTSTGPGGWWQPCHWSWPFSTQSAGLWSFSSGGDWREERTRFLCVLTKVIQSEVWKVTQSEAWMCSFAQNADGCSAINHGNSLDDMLNFLVFLALKRNNTKWNLLEDDMHWTGWLVAAVPLILVILSTICWTVIFLLWRRLKRNEDQIFVSV